jgi:hypothetical protein
MNKLKSMCHRSCCDCCETCCCDTGCANGSCGAPAVKIEGGTKSNNYEKMPERKADTKAVEPPLKPAGLETAPAVVPNVSVETEKSPF